MAEDPKRQLPAQKPAVDPQAAHVPRAVPLRPTRAVGRTRGRRGRGGQSSSQPLAGRNRKQECAATGASPSQEGRAIKHPRGDAGGAHGSA
ncbi:MAG: hypothetical protein CL844_05635 [Crocinitomicaceae bacterium]|nr:hypothetical protein [Crocinitomicaceae bacterium]